MYGLPRAAWERFGIWLAIGLVLYFTYGYTHSELRKRNEGLASTAGGRRS